MQKTKKSPKKEANIPARPITILEEETDGPERAREVIKKYNGELPSLQEFILWLKNSRNYKRAQEDQYWLRDKEVNISGPCKIDYEKGTIEKVSEEVNRKLPKEQKAFAEPGKGDVSLYVYADYADERLLISAKALPGPEAGRVSFVTAKSKGGNLKERAKRRYSDERGFEA